MAKTIGLNTWFALLRGINVGGRSIVPMDKLRKLFAGLGHVEVETYIQSGNVIFRSGGGAKEAGSFAAEAEKAIEAAFKRPVRVIVRTKREMERIASECPFPDADPSRVFVTFCDRKPRGTLDAARSPGDSFVIDGREVYLSCPKGAAETKFTLACIEKTLGVVGTARNWRTVMRLAGWE